MGHEADWSALNMADPTPGDAERVQQLINAFDAYATTSQTVGKTLAQVMGKASADNFEGKTAEKLRKVLSEDFVVFVDHFGRSMAQARDAITAYKPAMQAAQADADEVIRSARALRQREPDIKDDDPRLETMREQGRQAGGRMHAAAGAANTEIRNAQGLLHNPISAIELFWEMFNWIALALSVVAIFVGGPLAIIALVANAVLLIKTIIDFSHGDANGLQLGLAILGVLFPTTRGIGKPLIEGIAALGKSLGNGLRALGTGLSALGGLTLKGFGALFSGGYHALGSIIQGLTELGRGVTLLALRTPEAFASIVSAVRAVPGVTAKLGVLGGLALDGLVWAGRASLYTGTALLRSYVDVHKVVGAGALAAATAVGRGALTVGRYVALGFAKFGFFVVEGVKNLGVYAVRQVTELEFVQMILPVSAEEMRWLRAAGLSRLESVRGAFAMGVVSRGLGAPIDSALVRAVGGFPHAVPGIGAGAGTRFAGGIFGPADFAHTGLQPLETGAWWAKGQEHWMGSVHNGGFQSLMDRSSAQWAVHSGHLRDILGFKPRSPAEGLTVIGDTGLVVGGADLTAGITAHTTSGLLDFTGHPIEHGVADEMHFHAATGLIDVGTQPVHLRVDVAQLTAGLHGTPADLGVSSATEIKLVTDGSKVMLQTPSFTTVHNLHLNLVDPGEGRASALGAVSVPPPSQVHEVLASIGSGGTVPPLLDLRSMTITPPGGAAAAHTGAGSLPRAEAVSNPLDLVGSAPVRTSAPANAPAVARAGSSSTVAPPSRPDLLDVHDLVGADPHHAGASGSRAGHDAGTPGQLGERVALRPAAAPPGGHPALRVDDLVGGPADSTSRPLSVTLEKLPKYRYDELMLQSHDLFTRHGGVFEVTMEGVNGSAREVQVGLLHEVAGRLHQGDAAGADALARELAGRLPMDRGTGPRMLGGAPPPPPPPLPTFAHGPGGLSFVAAHDAGNAVVVTARDAGGAVLVQGEHLPGSGGDFGIRAATGERWDFTGHGWTVFDAHGHPQREVTYAGGATTTTQFDATGTPTSRLRVDASGTTATTFHPGPGGRTEIHTDPGGVTTTTDFNATNVRTSSVRVDGTSTTTESFDATSGARTAYERVTIAGTTTTTTTFDPATGLPSREVVHDGSVTTTTGFDAAGHRVSRVEVDGAVTTTEAFDAGSGARTAFGRQTVAGGLTTTTTLDPVSGARTGDVVHDAQGHRVRTEDVATGTVETFNPGNGQLLAQVHTSATGVVTTITFDGLRGTRLRRVVRDGTTTTTDLYDLTGALRSTEVRADAHRTVTTFEPGTGRRESTATVADGATHTEFEDGRQTWSRPGGGIHTRLGTPDPVSHRATLEFDGHTHAGVLDRTAGGQLRIVDGDTAVLLDRTGRPAGRRTAEQVGPDTFVTYEPLTGAGGPTRLRLDPANPDIAEVAGTGARGRLAEHGDGFTLTDGTTVEIFDLAGRHTATRAGAGFTEHTHGVHHAVTNEFALPGGAHAAGDAHTGTPTGYAVTGIGRARQWRAEQAHDLTTFRSQEAAWQAGAHRFEIRPNGDAVLRSGVDGQVMDEGRFAWDAATDRVTLRDATGDGRRVYGPAATTPVEEVIPGHTAGVTYHVTGGTWAKRINNTPVNDANDLLQSGRVSRANGVVTLKDDLADRPFVRRERTTDGIVYRYKDAGNPTGAPKGTWTFRTVGGDVGTTRFHLNGSIFQDLDHRGTVLRHYQLAKDGDMIRAARGPHGSWTAERLNGDGRLLGVADREWKRFGGPQWSPWTWQQWVDRVDGAVVQQLDLLGHLRKQDMTPGGPARTGTTWNRIDKDYGQRIETAGGTLIELGRLHEQRIKPLPWDATLGFGPRRPPNARGWDHARPAFAESRFREDLYQYQGYAETRFGDADPSTFGVRRTGPDSSWQDLAGDVTGGRGELIREMRTTMHNEKLQVGLHDGQWLSTEQIRQARAGGGVPFTEGTRSGVRHYAPDSPQWIDRIDGVVVREADQHGNVTEFWHPSGGPVDHARWEMRDTLGRRLGASDTFGTRVVHGERKPSASNGTWSDGSAPAAGERRLRVFNDFRVNPATWDGSYFDLRVVNGRSELVQEYRALTGDRGIKAWRDPAGGGWRWSDGRHEGIRQWKDGRGNWVGQPPPMGRHDAGSHPFRDVIGDDPAVPTYRENVHGVIRQYQAPAGGYPPHATGPAMEWTSYAFGDVQRSMRLVNQDTFLVELDKKFGQLRIGLAADPRQLLLRRGLDGTPSLTADGRAIWGPAAPLPRAWDNRGGYTEAQAWLRQTLDSDRRLLTDWNGAAGSTMITSGYQTLAPKLALGFVQELSLDFLAGLFAGFTDDGQLSADEAIRAIVSAAVGAAFKTALTGVLDRAVRSARGGISNLDGGYPFRRVPYSSYAFDSHYAHIWEQTRFRAWATDFGIGFPVGLLSSWIGSLAGNYATNGHDLGKALELAKRSVLMASTTGLAASFVRSVIHVSASGRLWVRSGPFDFFVPLPLKLGEKAFALWAGNLAWPKP